MNVLIVKAEESHLGGTINLIQEFAEFEKLSDWCQVTERDLRDAIFGEHKFVNCLIAQSGDALVGYAMFFPVFKSFRGERSIFLEDLYVTPAMRGNGLGFVMLKEVARYAKENGFVRMDWQALKWNEAAINFYKNLGAEADDTNFDFRLRGAAFDQLSS